MSHLRSATNASTSNHHDDTDDNDNIRNDHDHNRHPHHSMKTIKADAEFLERAVDEQLNVIVATGTATEAYTSLHRSNLLKIQTDQLLQECCIGNPDHDLLGSVKWYATIAEQYTDVINKILQNIPTTKLQTNVDGTNNRNIDSPFQLFADRSISVTINHPKHNSKLRVSDHYRKKSSLSALYQLGYTKPSSGNAHVLPLVERTVLLPNALFGDNDDDQGSISNSKDYLRHRYTDKRNAIVWHVAKFLSKPEFQSVIGKVYWRYWKNDTRKPVLLLIPPTIHDDENANDDSKSNKQQQESNNKKRKKKQRDEKKKIIHSILPAVAKMKKMRFHLLLHFGMESIDWIPPVRLLPNRCNAFRTTTTATTASSTTIFTKEKIQQSCFYNNQTLLEDARHLWYETAIGKLMSFKSGNDRIDHDNSPHAYDHVDFEESWYRCWNAATVLVKIWALQRGLLRGHDTLTVDIIILQLLYLFRTKQANAVRMTPVQIFTAWLKLIAETNWLGTNHYYNSKSREESNKILATSSNINKKQNRYIPSANKRSILVLPLPGKNEKQTVASSQLGKLYAEQAKASPISVDGDPPTLIELYQDIDPKYTGPVFLDPSMTYNYTGRLSPSFTIVLQREAQKSLDCLHSQSRTSSFSSSQQQGVKTVLLQKAVIQDPFKYLFMTETRFWKRHDIYVRLRLDQLQLPDSTSYTKLDGKLRSGRHQQDQLDDDKSLSNAAVADMGPYESVARTVVQVLQWALGDRIRAICTLTTANGSFKQNYHHLEHEKHEELIAKDKKIQTVLVDPDDIASYPIAQTDKDPSLLSKTRSPTGSQFLTLGITLNSDTCFRVVDRGPPEDHVDEVQAFLDLWGRQKAELRRFKDGAIVHAVVWDTIPSMSSISSATEKERYVQFQNDDKWQGGIVERIIQHIIKFHFNGDPGSQRMKKVTDFEPQFSLRNMNSIIDGVAVQQGSEHGKEQVLKNMLFTNPLAAHRMVLKAFDQLSNFLRKHSTPSIPVSGATNDMKSALQVPLAIDAVEPLSPCLRYAELFPPIPHPMLGASSNLGMKKVAGAIQSNPIEIQIRLGHSTKWPTDLKAIGAAKTAMLIALANGIESMKQDAAVDMDLFDGPAVVTSSYADIGFMGYVFRIFVRADPELKLLRSLRKPSQEAISMLRALTRKTVFAASHHTIVHAVYTKHPSSSAVVRMARRWTACHLLSDHIPFEALELLVAHVYTNRSSPLDPPGTVTVGFQRFLHLLASHDWQKEPVIVDPQCYFSDGDIDAIRAKFEQVRGSAYQRGPAMYIISPCNHPVKESDNDQDLSQNPGESEAWIPVFTATRPEQVVLHRAMALADRTYSFLRAAQTDFNSISWCAAFQESASAFRSYSALLRVDPTFVVDEHGSSDASQLDPLISANGILESSYTRSMCRRMEGPKCLRRKLYRNLIGFDDHLLLEWRPIPAVVQTLRNRLGPLALFFYNDLCPDVIAVVWRQPLFQPRAFSALSSEYAQPVTVDGWKADTLMTLNVGDILREIVQYTSDIVVDMKIFDKGPDIEPSTDRKRKHTERNNQNDIERLSTDDTSDSDSS